MTPETIQNSVAFAQWLETLGVISVMGLMLYFFITGKVIPRKSHEETTSLYKDRTTALENGISSKMDELVESNGELKAVISEQIVEQKLSRQNMMGFTDKMLSELQGINLELKKANGGK